ncbi:hypothetical protein LMG3412_05474 [Achromobacter deleyi]|nr:hypothetical protein LMG3412_05474 [Achromobacter deleyi]
MSTPSLTRFGRRGGPMAGGCTRRSWRVWVAAAWLAWPAGPGVAAGAVRQATGLHVASGVASLSALRFPPGSRVEPLADRMWLSGAPVQVVVFDAPVNAPELIRELSRQQPALGDLQVLPGQAILSGQVGDAWWVAQMESPEAGRCVGSISAIHAQPLPASVPPAWLPANARLRLDFTVLEGGMKVSEHIWQHPLPPARLALLLQQGLLRDGWRRVESEPAGAGRQSWRRQGAQLQWLLVPLDAGSGLWVRRWTP